MRSNEVWDGFDHVIVYKIPFSLLFFSKFSVLVFFQKLPGGLDVFQGVYMYVVFLYVINLSGIWFVVNVIGIDCASVGSSGDK